MRRLAAGLVLLVVLVVGVGIGALGRSLLGEDGAAGPAGQSSTASASATSAPAVGAPTSGPRSALPTITPAPVAIVPTPTPASRDVVVEVTEADLETQLRDMLVGRSLGSTPLGDATVQSVAVRLRDRQVQVSGGARVGFLTAPFTAAGVVTPDAAGRPIVTVTEATVGGALLPDSARTALAVSLQSQIDEQFGEGALKVRSIEIADGKMRLVGRSGS